jgi:hypothetical protein
MPVLTIPERADHLRSTFFQRPDRIADPLYVITPIFNPVRFRSRWKLYQDFETMCQHSGVILYTAEVAFGDRRHAITQEDNPHHIQLRTKHELWLKENVINIAVARLPSNWKYVAWIDSDTRFVRDDWANETIHRLQHYAAVQMWTQYQDLNYEQELVGTANSFISMYMKSGYKVLKSKVNKGYPYPHGYPYMGYPGAPGLAWAMRRDAWDMLDGGLLDVCILGAGDWYMAFGLVQALKGLVDRRNTKAYRDKIYKWGEYAKALNKNIGVVPGLALHYWHGPKQMRKYKTREQILIDAQFNPDTDMHKDWQGLYQLTNRSIQLRDEVRQYFHERQEDQL